MKATTSRHSMQMDIVNICSIKRLLLSYNCVPLPKILRIRSVRSRRRQFRQKLYPAPFRLLFHPKLLVLVGNRFLWCFPFHSKLLGSTGVVFLGYILWDKWAVLRALISWFYFQRRKHFSFNFDIPEEMIPRFTTFTCSIYAKRSIVEWSRYDKRERKCDLRIHLDYEVKR